VGKDKVPVAAALKKETFADPLSTSDEETHSPLPSRQPFDRSRLVRELLSLGHPKLTVKITERIGDEVAAELALLPAGTTDAEQIRDSIQRKLKELGVLEADAVPVPPQAALKVSERALSRLCRENTKISKRRDALEHLAALFENVARIAASNEENFPSSVDPKTLAVEFFNAMANQEFYPHLPSLLGDPHSPAYGGRQIALVVGANQASQQEILHQAQKIWRQGRSVSFLLDERGEGLNPDGFERFIRAVEKAILELPETVEIPSSMGLELSAGNPLSLDLVRMASSGKYYPKFNFTLKLPRTLWTTLKSPAGPDSSSPSNLDLLLGQVWRNSKPSFTLEEAESHGASTWRKNGGPALAPYETCQLGSLNVAILAAGKDVDWTKLRRMVRSAVHFLDNLIDVTEYPSEISKDQSLANRKIGIGVMGFAELLKKLGLPYEGDDARALAGELMRFIHREALQASQKLARERGVFPGYETSSWKKRGIPLRNATLTAVAPAEFLADLAGVSPGTVPSTEGISRSDRLRMQASFQKHSDGAVGQDATMPEPKDLQELKDLLKTAMELGIRQIHLQQNHALAIAPAPAAEAPEKIQHKAAPDPQPVVTKKIMKWVTPRKRPEILKAVTRQIRTGYGPMKVTLGYDEWGPYEIHIQLGKSGSHESAHAEALGRLVTLLLSSGVAPHQVFEELRGIRCPATARDQGEEVLSSADAVAKVLARELRLPAVGTADETTPLQGDEEITVVMEEETLH
jgi:ribonucleoside-diphosphate reductase alpha chain